MLSVPLSATRSRTGAWSRSWETSARERRGSYGQSPLRSAPTFVLIQEYEGSLPIYHCDTYRLKNVDEFLDLGIDEILQSEGVCLIEWADRVAGVLPPDHLRIEIEVTGPTTRSFRIEAKGPKSAAVVAAARGDQG
jgi:tRNA A37 threonylcarbamoyladenosine biosynthesis protein TsaE